MQILQVVPKEEAPCTPAVTRSFTMTPVMQWAVGIVVAFALGTWLVWWAASVQRMFIMDDIRSACHRLMPETAERCVDTVIVQRGGARR